MLLVDERWSPNDIPHDSVRIDRQLKNLLTAGLEAPEESWLDAFERGKGSCDPR